MKKHIIWKSDIDLDDFREEIEELYPEITDENEMWDIAYEMNSDFFDDERSNLRHKLDEQIICVADLSLWNGHRTAYKIIPSNNVADCLCSYMNGNITFYVDGYGNFKAEEYHHDSPVTPNVYEFRVWKKGLSDIAKENLLSNIFDQRYDRKELLSKTESIGKIIKSIYGW